MSEKVINCCEYWEMDNKQFEQKYLNSKSIKFVLYDENKTNYKNYSKNLRKLTQLENLEIEMIQPGLQYATYWLAQAINEITCLKSINLNIKEINEDFEGMTFLKKSFQKLKQLERLSLIFSGSYYEYFMKQRNFNQLLKGISYLTYLKQLNLQFQSINFDLKEVNNNISFDQLSQLTTLVVILETQELNSIFESQIFKVIKSIHNILDFQLYIGHINKTDEQLFEIELQLEKEQEFLLTREDNLEFYQQSFEQIPQQWNMIQNIDIQIPYSVIKESSLNKFFSNLNPNSIMRIKCVFYIASINTLKHILALNNLKILFFSVDYLLQTSCQEIPVNNSLEFLDLRFQPKGFVKSKDDFRAIIQNLQKLKTFHLRFYCIKDQSYSIIKAISKSFNKFSNLTKLVLKFYFYNDSYLLEESLQLANSIGQLIKLESLILKNGRNFLFSDPYTFKQLIKNIQKLNKLTQLKIILQQGFDDNQIMVYLKQIHKLIRFDKFNQFYIQFINLRSHKNIIHLKKEKMVFFMNFSSNFYIEEQLELTLSFIQKLQNQRSLFLSLLLEDYQENEEISQNKSDQILIILQSLQMIKIHQLQIISEKLTPNKEMIIQFLNSIKNIQQLNKLSLQFNSSLLFPLSKLRELIIKKLPKLVCIDGQKIDEYNVKFNNHDLEENEQNKENQDDENQSNNNDIFDEDPEIINIQQ